jgi:hypothetical protein
VGDGLARALRRRCRGALASAEADTARELVGDRIDLRLRALDAPLVVEALRRGELV